MHYRDGSGKGKKKVWTNLNLGKMRKTEPFGNKYESCLDFSLATSVRWRRKKANKCSEEKEMTGTTTSDQ